MLVLSLTLRFSQVMQRCPGNSLNKRPLRYYSENTAQIGTENGARGDKIAHPHHFAQQSNVGAITTTSRSFVISIAIAPEIYNALFSRAGFTDAARAEADAAGMELAELAWFITYRAVPSIAPLSRPPGRTVPGKAHLPTP
jgi:hypothetical protein